MIVTIFAVVLLVVVVAAAVVAVAVAVVGMMVMVVVVVLGAATGEPDVVAEQPRSWLVEERQHGCFFVAAVAVEADAVFEAAEADAISDAAAV